MKKMNANRVGAGLVPALDETVALDGTPANAERATTRVAPTDRTFIWTPDETNASGVYLVRAKKDNGQTAMKKIILVR